MHYPHARELFYKALRILVGPGTVQERLCGACVHELEVLMLEELPEELRGDFSDLRSQVRANPSPDYDGTIQGTIMNMTDDEAAECAHKVLALYGRIMRYEHPLPKT